LADVAEAFFIARTARVPVVLSVPTALQEAETRPEPYEPRPVPPRVDAEPDAAAVRDAARALSKAARPVILAGRGSLGAVGDLEELAELIGAPIGHTLPAKGDLGGRRYDVGPAGGY